MSKLDFITDKFKSKPKPKSPITTKEGDSTAPATTLGRSPTSAYAEQMDILMQQQRGMQQQLRGSGLMASSWIDLSAISATAAPAMTRELTREEVIMQEMERQFRHDADRRESRLISEYDERYHKMRDTCYFIIASLSIAFLITLGVVLKIWGSGK